MDALNSAISTFTDEQKANAFTALKHAGSSFTPWRERYRAVELVMQAAGAKRIKRSKLYNFPCGCLYEIHYARPHCLRYCEAHPEPPLVSPSAPLASRILGKTYVAMWMVSIGSALVLLATIFFGVLLSSWFPMIEPINGWLFSVSLVGFVGGFIAAMVLAMTSRHWSNDDE